MMQASSFTTQVATDSAFSSQLTSFVSASSLSPPPPHTAAHGSNKGKRTAINLKTEQHIALLSEPHPAHTQGRHEENNAAHEKNNKAFQFSASTSPLLLLLPQSPSFLSQRYSLMASHFREQLGLIIRQTNELKNESMQTERERGLDPLMKVKLKTLASRYSGLPGPGLVYFLHRCWEACRETCRCYS